MDIMGQIRWQHTRRSMASLSLRSPTNVYSTNSVVRVYLQQLNGLILVDSSGVRWHSLQLVYNDSLPHLLTRNGLFQWPGLKDCWRVLCFFLALLLSWPQNASEGVLYCQRTFKTCSQHTNCAELNLESATYKQPRWNMFWELTEH